MSREVKLSILTMLCRSSLGWAQLFTRVLITLFHEYMCTVTVRRILEIVGVRSGRFSKPCSKTPTCYPHYRRSATVALGVVEVGTAYSPFLEVNGTDPDDLVPDGLFGPPYLGAENSGFVPMNELDPSHLMQHRLSILFRQVTNLGRMYTGLLNKHDRPWH